MTNPMMTNPIPNPQPLTPKATGPSTAAGKQRSSQNALPHGLTAAFPVLHSEDRAAHRDHLRRFFDEYKPATATESQLVQEMDDTSWRLNRIALQSDRAERERHDLKEAAALMEFHKHKGLPWEPAEPFSDDGFVFSTDRVPATDQPKHMCVSTCVRPPARPAFEHSFARARISVRRWYPAWKAGLEGRL